MIDQTKRSRRGPVREDEKRRHCVSVRLNDAELAKLDSQRKAVKMRRGEYLRAASLHKLPPTIPEVNREAWVELARTSANLNQIARRLNVGEEIHLDEVRASINALRLSLIGVRYEEGSDES